MITIQDDVELLRLMMADENRQDGIHRSGPYWRSKGRVIAHEIERDGLAHFRDGSSLAGLSFADGPMIDYRRALNHGPRKLLGNFLTRVWPISAMFDAQVAWTRGCVSEITQLTSTMLRSNGRVHELLARYTMPESRIGDSVVNMDVDGRSISMHYLTLLDELDHVTAMVDLASVTSMVEIGGGFGANVHLMLANFPRLRKVLYVDVPPVLYVGTQYLRTLYGEAVLDYRATREAKTLRFRADDTLEILCITPWQLDRFRDSVDLLWNAHSFVEMPEAVVEHYARFFAALPNACEMAIALLTYDAPDPDRTIPPDKLPAFFPERSFERERHPRLLQPTLNHLFYVSAGAHRGSPQLATATRIAART